MYSKKVNMKASLFPTKQSMLKSDVKFKTVDVISNHYTPDIKDTMYITEWFLKIFKYKDEDGEDQLELYQQNPSHVKQDINPDSRGLIREIVGQNIKEIKKQTGFGFYSGMAYYTVQKKINKEYVIFDCHPEYVLIMEKKNQNISLGKLLANQECRRHPLQVLNSRIKHAMLACEYYEFGYERKFYNFKTPTKISQHGLELYKGYYFTLDIYEGGMRLMADLSNRIIRMENLWGYMVQKLEKNIRDKKALDRFFQNNITTMADYGNYRKYKIIGYDLSLSPMSPFPDKKFKNYKEYFVQRYKVAANTINQKQFLVLAEVRCQPYKKGDKIVKTQQVELIPQLLRPTGLTEQQKGDYRVMKDVAIETVIKPHVRKQQVEDMLEETFNQNKAKEQFQLKFDLDSNKITGYQLLRPQLKQAQGKPLNLKSGMIPLQNVNSSIEFKDWVIVHDFASKKYIDQLQKNIFKCSQRLKIKIQNPFVVQLPKPQFFKNPKEAAQFVDDFQKTELEYPPSIILYVVTKQTSRLLYSPVKKYYQKMSVPTQFLDSLRDKDMGNLSKISNIVVQMNNKLGGRGWELINRCDDTLAIGAEVSNLRTGKDVREMIAVCGQYGPNFKKQMAIASAKKTDQGKNTLKDLPKLVERAVDEYKKKQKSLPKNILLYRLGLGEGQIQDAISHEVLNIKAKLGEKYQNQAPKVVFMMVNKKINDRFYVKTQKGIDNPEGLVVMDEVVQKDRANFYMIPQKVNQGTATPCHYTVLDNDDSDLSLEKIIQVSMNLCWDYQNWNGPVRVPSVLMNAEKLCKLLCQIQSDTIPKELLGRLFYL